jgi:Protein of unknown function (DUF2971).
MISAEELRVRKEEKQELFLNIDEFEEIKDIRAFKESLKRFEDKLSQTDWDKYNIYHYTTGEGLKSIIENKELWFTNCGFLNDRTEIQHAYNLIDSVLDGFNSKENQNDIEEFKKCIDPYIKDNYGIYSASFSFDNDSNLLWSNYATDDGYNIEFDINKLNSMLEDYDDDGDYEIFGKIISPINYDEKMQRKLLQTELISLYKIFKYCKNNDMSQFRTLSETNIFNISLQSLFFKRKEFKQEQEFRIALICVDESKKGNVLKIRVKNGACMPYAAISLFNSEDKFPIKSITIGPKNTLDIAEKGLEYLLKWNGFEKNDVRIRKSDIPYRY